MYLTEQREPVRGCVALKAVKLGIDIVQVLAASPTSARRRRSWATRISCGSSMQAPRRRPAVPCFVMEYIEGAPITQYCAGRRMTIAQRLELFLAVCRAAQYAHRKRRDSPRPEAVERSRDGTGGPPFRKVIDCVIVKEQSAPRPSDR